MNSKDLVIYGENGHSINSTLITDNINGDYRIMRLSHEKISTNTVSTINLQIASVFEKFLAEGDAYTSRLQIFNERGFSFYGVPSEDWLRVKKLTVTKDNFNIRELVELTLPGKVLKFKKGHLFKIRVIVKPGRSIDPNFKALLEGVDNQGYSYSIYTVLAINKKKLIFFNPLTGRYDLQAGWNNDFDIDIKFIGGIEYHDAFSYSNWNEPDFYLRWDLQKEEFIDRPFTPVGFDFNDRFKSTGEKYYRYRPIWRLDILEVRDRIFKNIPEFSTTNNRIRVRLHDWKTLEGLGSTNCKLVYTNPTTKTQYNGLICRTRLQQLSYGDWIWMNGSVKIKNINYKITSTSFGNRIKVSSINGNTIIFDRNLPIDFQPIPTSSGQLPDPADFQDAIKKGRIRFSFSRMKTIDFDYISGLQSSFLNDSLNFFTNLRDVELKKYSIWTDINWPYINIDPRGSFNDYIISIDIDGEPIFGYNPTLSGPEFFRYADLFSPDIYQNSQILKGSSFIAISNTTYTDVSNYYPYSLDILRKKIRIGYIGPNGTLTIVINDIDYVYTSNEFNLSDRVNQWYLVWKDYINTQLGIKVSIDLSESEPILIFEGKYPPIQFNIFLPDYHQAFVLVKSIGSIDQDLFPSTFSLQLGTLQRGVPTNDIATDISLNTKQKSIEAYNRFLSNHETELNLFGWKFIVKDPYTFPIEAGPDINESSLEVWSSITLNPPIVQLSEITRGWFKERDILSKYYNFQAIISNKIYRKISGFSFVDMQIKPNDRILIENSMFKLNNIEMNVEQIKPDYLIVSSPFLFDQLQTYYRPYVLPFYLVDDEYVQDPDPNYRNFNDTNNMDRVSMYLLDRLFYPQSQEGNVLEELVIRWEMDEPKKKFFFIDIEGNSLKGREPDRVIYEGRKPLYLFGVKRKIYLVDNYNKNVNRNKNPYFQQTEFSQLKKELLSPKPSSTNWLNKPLQICIGYRSDDEIWHRNNMILETQKPVSITLKPSKRKNEDFRFVWSILNNRLSSNFVDFEKCGFVSGDKIEISVSLNGIYKPNGIVALNPSYIGIVKRVERTFLILKNIDTELFNEESINNINGTIEIKNLNIKILPRLIAKIEVSGEAEAEDKRLEIALRNWGIPLKDKDFYAIRSYREWEWGRDYVLINKKRIEMSFNRREIWDYVGSYKAIINSIKFFGHHQISIWNWALNLDTKSNMYGNWQRINLVKVEDVTENGWNDIDKDTEPPLPTPRWTRNNWIHLVWPRTDETGKFTHLYTERDEILQLGQLKRWEIENVIPMYNKLIDISSWSQNPWMTTTYNEGTPTDFHLQRSGAEAVRFKIEAYLNPVSKNDHSYICSIRFNYDDVIDLPTQGFWLSIITYNQEDGWKGKRQVQSIKEYRRTYEPYNFVMDWEIDPFAQVETIVEDPLTGLRAVNRRNIEIFSRVTR